MTQIILDTSVLIGLLDAGDLWHEKATSLKRALQAQGADIAVFECVVAEALSTIGRRIHEQRRDADLDRLVTHLMNEYPVNDIVWVYPDVPSMYAAVIDLVRSSGGELNFHDALIALACRERNIPVIASFDADFDHVSWLKRIARPEDIPPSD
jgi:predicted nucleic acid-binding protein